MRAPDFWRREKSVEASLLAPVAMIWGALAARRMRRVRMRPAIPTICVGNFVVGGAGKTPVVALLSELLTRRGVPPAILSRGYGGSQSGNAPLLVNPAIHTAGEVGDEPLLLARGAPVIVGADRRASCALAGELNARALIMDDGFQSASLEAISVVVVDGKMGVGNRRVLPSGPLRAPLDAQWPFVAAVLILGEGRPGRKIASEAEGRGLSVFRGRLEADPLVSQGLKGARALAFAGIGRPEKFYETLEELGVTLASRHSFRDHHAYTHADAARLFKAARTTLADLIVTTEKDMTRLDALRAACPEIASIRVLPVRARLDDEDRFSSWLTLALAAWRQNSDPRQVWSPRQGDRA